MQELIVGESGDITLPIEVRTRYGLNSGSLLRLVETGAGVLLVPSTYEPPDKALASELEEWQALGAQALSLFPYKDLDR